MNARRAVRAVAIAELFQEQLMQMAMAIGGINGDEADLLRRAMGSKRGIEKISSLKQQLYDGMARSWHHRRPS
jgi:error-prone DNA polymerase